MTTAKKRRVQVSSETALTDKDYDILTERIRNHSQKDGDCVVVDYSATDGSARMDYDRRSFVCHVIAWEAWCNGKKQRPHGMFVAHKCKQMGSRKRSCVRPEHLVLVNTSDLAKMQSVTPEAVLRIRKVKTMLAENKSVESICEETGMKKSAVYDIRGKKTWAFIE